MTAPTTYTFRQIDTSGDGIIQQAEVDAFKRSLVVQINQLANGGNFDSAEKFKALEEAGFGQDYRKFNPVTFTPQPSLGEQPVQPQPDPNDPDSPNGPVKPTQSSDSGADAPTTSIYQRTSNPDEALKGFYNKPVTFGVEEDNRGFWDRLWSSRRPYSAQEAIENIYNARIAKIVGKSIADKGFINANSAVRVSDQEYKLYNTFTTYAVKQADGSYVLDQAGAQKLIATFKRPGDTGGKDGIDVESQKALMAVSGVYCGAKPGETCSVMSLSTPVVSADTKKPVQSWNFYGFFSKL